MVPSASEAPIREYSTLLEMETSAGIDAKIICLISFIFELRTEVGRGPVCLKVENNRL